MRTKKKQLFSHSRGKHPNSDRRTKKKVIKRRKRKTIEKKVRHKKKRRTTQKKRNVKHASNGNKLTISKQMKRGGAAASDLIALEDDTYYLVKASPENKITIMKGGNNPFAENYGVLEEKDKHFIIHVKRTDDDKVYLEDPTPPVDPAQGSKYLAITKQERKKELFIKIGKSDGRVVIFNDSKLPRLVVLKNLSTEVTVLMKKQYPQRNNPFITDTNTRNVDEIKTIIGVDNSALYKCIGGGVKVFSDKGCTRRLDNLVNNAIVRTEPTDVDYILKIVDVYSKEVDKGTVNKQVVINSFVNINESNGHFVKVNVNGGDLNDIVEVEDKENVPEAGPPGPPPPPEKPIGQYKVVKNSTLYTDNSFSPEKIFSEVRKGRIVDVEQHIEREGQKYVKIKLNESIVYMKDEGGNSTLIKSSDTVNCLDKKTCEEEEQEDVADVQSGDGPSNSQPDIDDDSTYVFVTMNFTFHSNPKPTKQFEKNINEIFRDKLLGKLKTVSEGIKFVSAVNLYDEEDDEMGGGAADQRPDLAGALNARNAPKLIKDPTNGSLSVSDYYYKIKFKIPKPEYDTLKDTFQEKINSLEYGNLIEGNDEAFVVGKGEVTEIVEPSAGTEEPTDSEAPVEPEDPSEPSAATAATAATAARAGVDDTEQVQSVQQSPEIDIKAQAANLEITYKQIVVNIINEFPRTILKAMKIKKGKYLEIIDKILKSDTSKDVKKFNTTIERERVTGSTPLEHFFNKSMVAIFEGPLSELLSKNYKEILEDYNNLISKIKKYAKCCFPKDSQKVRDKIDKEDLDNVEKDIMLSVLTVVCKNLENLDDANIPTPNVTTNTNLSDLNKYLKIIVEIMCNLFIRTGGDYIYAKTKDKKGKKDKKDKFKLVVERGFDTLYYAKEELELLKTEVPTSELDDTLELSTNYEYNLQVEGENSTAVSVATASVATASESETDAPQASSASTTGVKVMNHPRYNRFVKMIEYGTPLQAVKNKMRIEDPQLNAELLGERDQKSVWGEKIVPPESISEQAIDDTAENNAQSDFMAEIAAHRKDGGGWMLGGSGDSVSAALVSGSVLDLRVRYEKPYYKYIYEIFRIFKTSQGYFTNIFELLQFIYKFSLIVNPDIDKDLYKILKKCEIFKTSFYGEDSKYLDRSEKMEPNFILLLESQRQSVTRTNILHIKKIFEEYNIINEDTFLDLIEKVQDNIKRKLRDYTQAEKLIEQLKLSCDYNIDSKKIKEKYNGEIVIKIMEREFLDKLNSKKIYNNNLIEGNLWYRNVLINNRKYMLPGLAPGGANIQAVWANLGNGQPSDFDLPPRNEVYDLIDPPDDTEVIAWKHQIDGDYKIDNKRSKASSRKRGFDTPDGNFVFCFQKYKYNDDKVQLGMYMTLKDRTVNGEDQNPTQPWQDPTATVVGITGSFENQIKNIYNTLYTPRTIDFTFTDLKWGNITSTPAKIRTDLAWKTSTMQINNYPCVGININTRENNFTTDSDVNPPRFIYSEDRENIKPYKQICCHICSQQCYQRLFNIGKITSYNNINPSVLHHTDEETVYCGEYHKLEGTKKMFTKLKETVKHIHYNFEHEIEKKFNQDKENKKIFNSRLHQPESEEKYILDTLKSFFNEYVKKAKNAKNKLDELMRAKEEAIKFIEYTNTHHGKEMGEFYNQYKPARRNFFDLQWPKPEFDKKMDLGTTVDWRAHPPLWTLITNKKMNDKCIEWIKKNFENEIKKLQFEEVKDNKAKLKIELEATEQAEKMIDAWIYKFRDNTDITYKSSKLTIEKPDNIEYWMEEKYNDFIKGYCIDGTEIYKLKTYLNNNIKHFVELTKEPKKGFSAKLTEAVNCGGQIKSDNSLREATHEEDVFTTIKSSNFNVKTDGDYDACLNPRDINDRDDFYNGWTIKTSGGISIIEEYKSDGHIKISNDITYKIGNPKSAIGSGSPYILTNRIPEFLGLSPGIDMKAPLQVPDVYQAVTIREHKNYLEEQNIFPSNSQPEPNYKYTFDKVEHVYLDERKFKELTKILDKINIEDLGNTLKECGRVNNPIYNNKNNFFEMYNIFMGIEDDNYKNDWGDETDYYKIHLNPVGRENYDNYGAHMRYYDSILSKKPVTIDTTNAIDIEEFLRGNKAYPFELFNIDESFINDLIEILEKGEDNIFEVYKCIYGILYLLFNIAHYIVGSPAPPDSIVGNDIDGTMQRFGIQNIKPKSDGSTFNYHAFTILDNGEIIKRKTALINIKNQLKKLQFPDDFYNTIIDIVLESVSITDILTLKNEYKEVTAGGRILVSNNKKLKKGGSNLEKVLNYWIHNDKLDENFFTSDIFRRALIPYKEKNIYYTINIFDDVSRFITLYNKNHNNDQLDRNIVGVKKLLQDSLSTIDIEKIKINLGKDDDTGENVMYITHNDLNYGIKKDETLIKKVNIRGDIPKEIYYIKEITNMISNYIIRDSITLDEIIKPDRELIVSKFQIGILNFILKYLRIIIEILEYFKSSDNNPLFKSLKILYDIQGSSYKLYKNYYFKSIAEKITSSGDENLIVFLGKYNEYKLTLKGKDLDIDSLSYKINSSVLKSLSDYLNGLIKFYKYVEENTETLEQITGDSKEVMKVAMKEAMDNAKIKEAIDAAYDIVKADAESKRILINISK